MIRARYRMTNELNMVPGERNLIIPLEKFDKSENNIGREDVIETLAGQLNESKSDIELLDYEQI